MARQTHSSDFDPFREYSVRPATSGSSTPLIASDALLPVDTATSTSTTPPSRTPPKLSDMDIPITSTASLAVNYLPSKFSQSIPVSISGPYRRKAKRRKPAEWLDIPKYGGGIDAFRSGEARIGSDYGDGDHTKRKRWTRFKWVLFVANILLTCYSIVALITCLLVWFNVFHHSQVIFTVNKSELIASTIAAVLGVFTCVVGWAGILLNNRAFLAVYTFILWLVFASIALLGYLSYRRRTFNLEGKLDNQWSRDLSTADRLLVQNELACCGYYNTFVEATISATCYSRSVLPGCKMNLLVYERWILKRFYASAFGLVPFHVLVMVAGLLCSNHVTYRFGKGMMPQAYRLDLNTVAAIMDTYANELAELYGIELATDIWKRSQLQLMSSTTSTPYSTHTTSLSSQYPRRLHYRHDSTYSRG